MLNKLLFCFLLRTRLILVLSIGLGFSPAYSQELEPRALTNIPVGTNFVLVGYGYGQGNILFDPAVPLEDTNAKLNTMIAAYLRSIELFGLSGKVDVIVPYGIGNWTGIHTGVDTTTSRSGFGDIRFRLSLNFLGAPALQASEFKDYHPENISGFSIQIIAPTGQYDPEKIINLGSNRWVFKPQWGFARNFDKWILESYISAWLYTANSEFLEVNELKQKPILTFKVHAIRKFKNSSWLALDAGYGRGGRSVINDVERDNRISSIRLGATYAFPLGAKHTLRVSGVSGIRLEQGADFDALTMSYQYRWLN